MNTAANRMIYQTEKTREKILSGAQQIFVENGYDATQMKDIATAVGISRHSLYRYYRNKTDLGYAVYSRIIRGFETDSSTVLSAQAGKPDMNARQTLLAALLAFYKLPRLQLDFLFLAEFDAFNSGSRLPKDFVQHMPEPVGNRLFANVHELVKRGVAEGSIRSDKPTKELTQTIGYSVQSLAYSLLSRGEALYGVSESERDRMLETLCALLEDGLRP